jgi:LysR family transcriptional regulator, carnitine catabolism transcriptional activator
MLDVPDLSAKHLRAVVTLARFGSFVAAAAHLHMSQPGLSRIIQQVERRLGVQLFVRATKSVLPTDAGREFVPAAERLLGELSQQIQKVRTLDGEMRGQLIISSLMSISHHVLPAALVEFRKQHSKMFVHVREGLAIGVQEDVRSGFADFGIGNAVGVSEGIAVESITTEPCYVVLPRRHRLHGLSAIKLRDISDDAMISMPTDSGLRRTIDAAATAQGLVLNHSIITNQFGSLFDFVANNLGIAIVPAAALPAANEYPIVARPLRPAITRRICILRLAERPLSPASKAFLDIFQPKFLAAIGRQHRRERDR